MVAVAVCVHLRAGISALRCDTFAVMIPRAQLAKLPSNMHLREPQHMLWRLAILVPALAGTPGGRISRSAIDPTWTTGRRGHIRARRTSTAYKHAQKQDRQFGRFEVGDRLAVWSHLRSSHGRSRTRAGLQPPRRAQPAVECGPAS